MIDRRPRLIVPCADVIAAVHFGRENDLLVAIRGGGHNGAGPKTIPPKLKQIPAYKNVVIWEKLW